MSGPKPGWDGSLIQMIADHAPAEIAAKEAEAQDLEEQARDRRAEAQVLKDVLAVAQPHARNTSMSPPAPSFPRRPVAL